MAKIVLCSNCLEDGAKERPIGHEKGDQRDPYFDTIALCDPCWTALAGGELGTFRRRYKGKRQVVR